MTSRVRLHTKVTGPHDGPLLLLLHGGGLSGWQWEPQVEGLNAYRCFVPDLPGHGESRSLNPSSLEDATREVLGALEHYIDRGRFHVVGSSFGGLIALHLLSVAPKRVATVMVSGSAVGLGRLLGAVSHASAAIYRFLPTEPLVKLSYAQFGIPEPYRELFRSDVLRMATPDFSRKITKLMMSFQLPTEAHVPVLAVVGQKETFAAKGAARRVPASLPLAQEVEVPDVGHVWNLQAPELFNATVRAWTTQTPLPALLQPLHVR